MDTTTEEFEVLNNKDGKENFMKLIRLHYQTSFLAEKRSTIHLMQRISIQKILNLNSYLLSKKRPQYEVIEVDGKDIVGVREQGNFREVLPFTKIYKFLMILHVRNGHELSDSIKDKIDVKYIIPSLCYDLIPKVCDTCNKSSKGIGTPRNGVVTFLHNMAKRSKHMLASDAILIYLDEYSEYIILRPTKATNDVDVTMEIFKIFMEFGPPDKVYIYPKPGIAFDLKKTLNMLFPMCTIINEPRYEEAFFSSLVMEILISWMTETKSKSWELGCSLVQKRINNMLKPSLVPGLKSVTAGDLFFNRIYDITMTTKSKGNERKDRRIEKYIAELEIKDEDDTEDEITNADDTEDEITNADDTEDETEADKKSESHEDEEVDFGADA